MDQEVDAKRNKRAFGVLAQDRIRRIFILTVVLDPGIKARVRQTLYLPRRSREHLIDGAFERLQIGFSGDHACSKEHEIVVVGRESLENPEQARVVLTVWVVVHESLRSDAL
jgi:hypothetical protein